MSENVVKLNRFPRVQQGAVRPLLIGEAPGPNTDPRAPLFPLPSRSSGGILQKMTGLNRGDYLRTFDRLNLFYRHPGTWESSARGKDKWSQRDARIVAESLRPLLAGREVLLVGRRTAEAFGYSRDRMDFFSWSRCEDYGVVFACIPHPSGRNHYYNDPGNRERARAFLEAWVAALNKGCCLFAEGQASSSHS